MVKRQSVVLMALGPLLMASCQQSSIGSRTYPDAIVALHQVDPAYRPYFAAQNGSNYSMADQRAAFFKAAQTAKGPMPSYEARPSGTRVHRKAKASSRPSARRGKNVKAAGKKKAVKRTTRPRKKR